MCQVELGLEVTKQQQEHHGR